MKPIALVLIVALPLALVGALVGGFLIASRPALELQAETPTKISVAGPAGPSIPPEELRTLRGELDMLSSRVAELEGELERVREEGSRTPALERAALEETTGRALSAASIGLTEPQREAVLQVLAEERARADRERAEEREQRERTEIERRVERVAKELGLSASDQTTLVGFYTEASKKREALMDQMRESGFDRDGARASFEELRDWSSGELERLFGAPLAGEILAFERGRGSWDGRRERSDRGSRNGVPRASGEGGLR